MTLEEMEGYLSPRDFPIGKHDIHYIVTDKAGLKAHCEFKIEVQGELYIDIIVTHNYSLCHEFCHII